MKFCRLATPRDIDDHSGEYGEKRGLPLAASERVTRTREGSRREWSRFHGRFVASNDASFYACQRISATNQRFIAS
jgi:hypothetical protein